MSFSVSEQKIWIFKAASVVRSSGTSVHPGLKYKIKVLSHLSGSDRCPNGSSSLTFTALLNPATQPRNQRPGPGPGSEVLFVLKTFPSSLHWNPIRRHAGSRYGTWGSGSRSRSAGFRREEIILIFFTFLTCFCSNSGWKSFQGAKVQNVTKLLCLVLMHVSFCVSRTVSSTELHHSSWKTNA